MQRDNYVQMFEEYDIHTPCYIFDEDELKDRVAGIQEALGAAGIGLCYAIKANPFLVPAMDEIIDRYEVCSPGELEICRKAKIDGKKIIFSGVVKSYEDIRAALEYPVDVITVESLRHWQLLKECIADTGRSASVLLRLTSGAQFGMREDEIRLVLKEIQTLSQIDFAGIHYFAGTQRKSGKYEKELPGLAVFMKALQADFGLENMVLEYGPGLMVPYFEGGEEEDFPKDICALAGYIKEQDFPFQVTVELGRYIAASCGRYVTRIVDLKQVEDRNYCLVDGGIHQVSYYGQSMAMRKPYICHVLQGRRTAGSLSCGHGDNEQEKAGSEDRQNEDRQKEYMVCGSLCTFADILVRGLLLSDPQIGDFLVFERIGAYSVTETGYLFLSRDFPAIYSYGRNRGLCTLRRKRVSWEINVADQDSAAGTVPE